MEIFFKVQPTLPSKNKIAPYLSEHDCPLVFFSKTGINENLQI
jgi:hypothetical protein